MENLLRETENHLSTFEKTPNDVLWVGVDNKKITWENFATLAKDINSNFGGADIATDLVIVGDGWWLKRWEYDYCGGWEFIIPLVDNCDFSEITISDIYHGDGNYEDGYEPITKNHNGVLTSSQNGYIGGLMVKKMIEAQERQMRGE